MNELRDWEMNALNKNLGVEVGKKDQWFFFFFLKTKNWKMKSKKKMKKEKDKISIKKKWINKKYSVIFSIIPDHRLSLFFLILMHFNNKNIYNRFAWVKLFSNDLYG